MSNPDDLRRTSSGPGVNSDRTSTPSPTRSRRPRSPQRQTRQGAPGHDVGSRIASWAPPPTSTDSTHDAVEHAGDAVADAPQKVASATRGNPIAVGLIAFGVGWLAASLIPASNAGQRAADQAKDAAAPLLDEVKDVAAETADHLREPARNAVDAVKDRASEAVDTVTEEGAGCGRGCADRSEARRRESPVVGRPAVHDRIADPRPARDSARDRAASHVGGRPPWRARDSRVGSRARPLLAVHFRTDSVTCRLGRTARCSVGFDRLIPSGDLLGKVISSPEGRPSSGFSPAPSSGCDGLISGSDTSAPLTGHPTVPMPSTHRRDLARRPEVDYAVGRVGRSCSGQGLPDDEPITSPWT